MSTQPYDPNYPVEIDLDRTVPSFDSPLAAGGKKSKPKETKQGAFLSISGGPELAKLPKHGYALIEFDRTEISLGKKRGPSLGPDDKGEEARAELEVHSICLPEEEKGGLADDFAKFAAKKGVDTEGMGGAPEEETPDEDQAEGGEEEEET